MKVHNENGLQQSMKHGAAANMNLYSFDNDNGCKVKNEKYNSYSTGNIWSTQQVYDSCGFVGYTVSKLTTICTSTQHHIQYRYRCRVFHFDG